jgi:hypothetical protein
LANIEVIDNQPTCALGHPIGDNGNAVLDPGESWVYKCSMTITQRTRNVATAYGTDIRGNRWSAQDSVLVRTSHRCVTVAGVQDVEACMAMEEGIDAGHRLYLPITQR